MAQPVIQTSFHAGEWAPALNARVDLAKYHAGAALLRNFFVDYRGGASSRPGTEYILQCYKSSTAVRLIGFQASFTLGYILEFGDFYLRFYNSGAAVLETALTITGASQANPAVITVANTFAVDDWVYITGVVGMTQLNGNYYRLSATAAGNVTLSDLNGVAINSLAYTAYSSGGTMQRVYTLATPWAAADLALLKFTANINNIIFTHPSYTAQQLTLISAANWSLIPITYGTTITAPTGLALATSLGAGNISYAYTVTSVDINGQESSPATPVTVASARATAAATDNNRITWNSVAGASLYNVYKARTVGAGVAVPVGAAYGYVGNVTGVEFNDALASAFGITPDFSITPPIAKNPFLGAGVASYTVTTTGTYTTVPTVSVTGGAGSGATAHASLGAITTVINDIAPFHSIQLDIGSPSPLLSFMTLDNGVILQITGTTFISTSGGHDNWKVTAVSIYSPGSITSGSTPANPESPTGSSAPGFQAYGGSFNFDLTWGVTQVIVISAGTSYTSAPSVAFSAGAAAATAVLETASAGNPAVPGYYQQRLCLAGQTQSPQSFNLSQPGSYFNFNISNPIKPDDAISGLLVSTQLNSIKSLVSMPTGLLILTDKASWLLNGGTGGAAITPLDATANAHSYNGASDVPPIVANFDALYVQAKGSIVRNLSYNLYAQVFTGTDISVLSSHLFYGYTVTEWAWAEEPFKVVWAVRDDGTMLTLTFLKEQELIGWAHSDTGPDSAPDLFKSVASVTETVASGAVDAVYTVVERAINGNTVKYVERFAERIFTNGATDAWCVDAGIQYDSTPATTFTGATHLAGCTVTGLADGVAITPFVMATNGSFTLSSAASKVTVGLPFIPQLQTLQIDLGEPTVQGKRKKITAVTVRVQDTLGLSIGNTASDLVPMKDLVVGNVGSATNTVVTDLVTADARTIIPPQWTVPGQYFIQQSNPFPATILGVIPEIVAGDTVK